MEHNGMMPEQAINADEVVGAALDLLDDVGLHGFTMRALAQRLGTYPATIYWHVGSRGEVLSAASGRVLDTVFADLPDPTLTPWDAWLDAFARGYRRQMQSHPAIAAWGVTHFEARVPAPDGLEGIVGVFARAGFHDEALALAYNMFLGSLIGWIGVELIADDPELGSDPEQMEGSVRALDADDYPTIVANLDHLANHAFAFRWQGGIGNPLDAAFDFAVATWIVGLRAQLANRAG